MSIFKRDKIRSTEPQPITADAPYVLPLADKLAGKLTSDAMPGYQALFANDSITPAMIQTALQAYRKNGKLQALSNLLDLFMDADDSLQAAVDVRKEALKRTLWSFGEDMPEDRQAFYDQLLSDNISNWIDVFIEGKLYGYQFLQIMWEVRDGRYVPGDLVTYNNLDLRIENRKLILYNDKGPVTLPDYKFVNILYRRPKLHSVIKYYVFYAYAMNYWAQFTETYGKPPRIGRYDPMTTTKELDVLKAAVKALGTDQAAIISKNTEIEFKDFSGKQTSLNLYETLCNFVSDRVTRKILGNTLTTQEGDTGTYAQARVHQGVQEEIQMADITDLREFVNVILDYTDRVNFGGEGVNVWMELPRSVDLQQRMSIDQTLVNLGLPVSHDYFYDTYGVDRPAEGQELMPKPSSPWAEPMPPLGEDRNNAEDGQVAVLTAEPPQPVAAQIALSETSAKLLSQLQREIRGLKSLEELKAYVPRWFIAEFGGRLAAQAVAGYIEARKALKSRKGRHTELPPLIWEWDEASVLAAGKFRNQAFIVSGVRAKAALRDLQQIASDLVEAGGDFRDFIQTAELNGFSPDNPQHWLTEFETAKVAAASAGRWQEFEEDKDIFPYLRYLTMQDDLVREEHRELNGVVAPVDDAFWAENYPPNGWNCRCYVEQLTTSEAQQAPGFGKSAPGYHAAPGFRGNPGRDGLPGGAEQHYNEYEDGPDKDLFTDRPDHAQRLDAKPRKAFKLKEGDIATMDVNGYPVIAGQISSAKLLTDPTEIWQANGVTTYIRLGEDMVHLATVKAGVFTEERAIARDEYNNEGRQGFREFGDD